MTSETWLLVGGAVAVLGVIAFVVVILRAFRRRQ